MSRIVFPGEVVSEKPVRASYTYTDGTKAYATVVSLMSDDGKLVPLEGPYEPLAEDAVIGFVSDVKFAGYSIDLGAPFTGFLSSRDTRATFALGDIVQARILNVDEVKSIDLADGRKLENGAIEKISPVKVPRLIGKRNSMINMLAYASGCQIIVGRNGFVFVSNAGDHALVRRAIAFVGAQAHTSGLTDRVAAMLSEACGKPVSPDVIPAPVPSSGGYGSHAGGPGGERREYGSGFGRGRPGGFGRSGGERRGGRDGPRREGGYREGGRRPYGQRRDGPYSGSGSQTGGSGAPAHNAGQNPNADSGDSSNNAEQGQSDSSGSNSPPPESGGAGDGNNS